MSFFFQAEDGIRYLVRSRGLGDVYKRQAPHPLRATSLMGYAVAMAKKNTTPEQESLLGSVRRLTGQMAGSTLGPVSYTHLTLPTSDLV